MTEAMTLAEGRPAFATPAEPGTSEIQALVVEVRQANAALEEAVGKPKAKKIRGEAQGVKGPCLCAYARRELGGMVCRPSA